MSKEEILAMLLMPEQLKPIVDQAKKVLDMYAPELEGVMRRITMSMAESKVQCIRYYESQGFTREEAMFLVMDEWYAMARALRSSNSKSKSK